MADDNCRYLTEVQSGGGWSEATKGEGGVSTITYDERGLCTRCGSTGYYLSSYISDSSFADERSCVAPCPCHGWRPVSCAPEYVEVLVGKRFPGTTDPSDWDMAKAWLMSGKWFADGEPLDPAPTHWQPEPQPPEGV